MPPLPSQAPTRIVGLSYFVPDEVLTNEQLEGSTGRPASWFFERTGILERRLADVGDDTNALAMKAARMLLADVHVSALDIDLVIGATYTPSDTVATHAHWIQREFGLRQARVFCVSAACCSFLNALEIAHAFFQAGRSRTALIVAADHNSAWIHEDNAQCAHLFGDGAAACLVTCRTDLQTALSLEVLEVATTGLAHVGKGPWAASLKTCSPERMNLPHGSDLFHQARQHLTLETRRLLRAHGLGIDDLSLFVPHQADARIIEQVARDLDLAPGHIATTVTHFGNLGSASIPVALAAWRFRIPPDGLAACVAFGGGYSMGSALLRNQRLAPP